jgi:hypothetical protein
VIRSVARSPPEAYRAPAPPVRICKGTDQPQHLLGLVVLCPSHPNPSPPVRIGDTSTVGHHCPGVCCAVDQRRMLAPSSAAHRRAEIIQSAPTPEHRVDPATHRRLTVPTSTADPLTAGTSNSALRRFIQRLAERPVVNVAVVFPAHFHDAGRSFNHHITGIGSCRRDQSNAPDALLDVVSDPLSTGPRLACTTTS